VRNVAGATTRSRSSLLSKDDVRVVVVPVIDRYPVELRPLVLPNSLHQLPGKVAQVTTLPRPPSTR
jgi:hypothetical protein